MVINYKGIESELGLIRPTDEEFSMHFSTVPENKRDKFVYLKGRVVSKTVNKKMIRFTDKALNQTVNEFKPHPLLVEHNDSLKDMIGTVTSLSVKDDGLFYFSTIPVTSKTEHYISMLEADNYGIIKTSIGGLSNSITCSLCGKEIRDDYAHQLGEKYDGKLVFGNVNEWRTKEISLTITPADENTSTSLYDTGFNLSNSSDLQNSSKGGETFINDYSNYKDDSTMTDDNTDNTEVKGQEISLNKIDEMIKNSLPDTGSFATKDDLNEIKTLLMSMVEIEKQREEARLNSLRKELSEMTGKDIKVYQSLGEDALSLMIDDLKTFRSDVPPETGVADFSGGNIDKSVKVTPEMKKEAIRVILGIREPSKKVSKKISEYYSDYNTFNTFTESIYDKVNRTLVTKFKNEEGDK